MSHALVNFSQSSAGDLGPVAGVGGFRVGKLGKFAHLCNKVSYVRAMHVNDNNVHSIVIRCAAPPIIVDALSTAVLLGQSIDYYYYYALFYVLF